MADLQSGIERIVDAPGSGHRRADLTSRDVRFYLVHSYLIIYRPKTQPLHVIRVLHAARDIKSILKE